MAYRTQIQGLWGGECVFPIKVVNSEPSYRLGILKNYGSILANSQELACTSILEAINVYKGLRTFSTLSYCTLRSFKRR